MVLDSKALKVEQITEVVSKLKICTDILCNISPMLTEKLEIDKDIFDDFSLAKSRLDYIADHLRRQQIKLRKQ